MNPVRSVSFFTQSRSLSLQLCIQCSVIAHHAPVRRYALFARAQVLLRGLRGDAHEDARRNRASDIRPLRARQSFANLRLRNQPAATHGADQRINIQRAGNQHLPAPIRFLHSGWNIDHLRRPVHLLTPGLPAFHALPPRARSFRARLLRDRSHASVTTLLLGISPPAATPAANAHFQSVDASSGGLRLPRTLARACTPC